MFFSKLNTPIRSIFPRVHRNLIFSTRLINLSKPHPKVMKIISNNIKNNMKHNKFEKHKMESEMKFYLRQRLQTGTKNVPSMKKLASISIFFMSFIYCKTTYNPSISTCVNKLMINYHFLCYFCEIFGHLGFYPPKNPPMNIQSKQILCG